MRSKENGRAYGRYGAEDAFVPDTFLGALRIARDPDGARPSSKQEWYLRNRGVWRDDLSRRQAHWLIEGLKTGVVVPNGG